MKRIHMKIIVCLCTVFILTGVSVSSAAAYLDFGWGTPVLLTHKGKNLQETYVAWPIQISNNTNQRLVPQLDIVAVTDTGKQYSPASGLKVSPQEDSKEITSLADLRNNIFPAVTRRALAIFKDIDPKATVIHFYIGGLENGGNPAKENTKYLRITYKKRLRTGWELDSTDVME